MATLQTAQNCQVARYHSYKKLGRFFFANHHHIFSIMLNTPMESLKEIIIVDDRSSRGQLQLQMMGIILSNLGQKLSMLAFILSAINDGIKSLEFRKKAFQ